MRINSDQVVVKIMRAEPELIPSFHACLDSVARELIYLEMIEAPPLVDIEKFQRALIENGAPVVYAVRGAEVIGWCDISPYKNPRLAHRGGLGMGVRDGHRGEGLGTKLLTAALSIAKAFGLEKVELEVYATNPAAIALYERAGFEREGFIKNYRKLEGRYFDCIRMAKSL